jgi:hypothetical protein
MFSAPTPAGGQIMETATQPIPAIPSLHSGQALDLEKAIGEFHKTVEPLLDPTQEENWDGTKLKAKEWAILQAGLQLVGQCIALLIYQLVVTESVKLAANLRAQGTAGLNYVNQAFKEVTITLIGGVQVRVPTLYKLSRNRKEGRGRKRKRGKRRESRGQGFYPVLVLLGISEGASPLVRCLVTQAATQAVSFEQARPMIAWLGLNFSTRRIRRISVAFGRMGLQVRAQRMARLAAGDLLPGNALRGKRVVVSVDGGRINIREPKTRGRKRKSGRRGYEANWREPKLLTIYVLDEEGRKVVSTDVPLVQDGTLLGLEEFLALLRAYLQELGIAQAEAVVLIGDGAPWIWENVPPLLRELGCRPEQITEVLDYYHASEHLHTLAEALFGHTSQAKGWARQWARRLKRGCARSLLAEVSRYLSGKDCKDMTETQKQHDYFHRHQEHGRLDYAQFKAHRLPIGSGVVESLIRQVVNLRLKSSGKFWLLETAEAFLHARCQWAAHLWSSFCDAVLTAGLMPLPAI